VTPASFEDRRDAPLQATPLPMRGYVTRHPASRHHHHDPYVQGDGGIRDRNTSLRTGLTAIRHVVSHHSTAMAMVANTAMNAAINAAPLSLSRKVVCGSQRGSEGCGVQFIGVATKASMRGLTVHGTWRCAHWLLTARAYHPRIVRQGCMSSLVAGERFLESCPDHNIP
jgi:hypothetical protein